MVDDAERRKTTAESYRARMARVAAHIERAVRSDGAGLDLDSLAEIACFSRFHFHRIYRAMMGETAAQTVRRLRLHRAAVALRESDAPVAEIAAQAGYTLEAFSRAFSAAYRMSPAAFRASGCARAGDAAPRPQQKADQETFMTEVMIAEREPLRLAALAHRGPYHEIGAAFEQLSLWAGGQGLFGPETRMVGVYYDDPQEVAAADLRSDAGLTVAESYEPPEPAHLVRLAGGPHAVLRHVGPYATLPRAYDHVYGAWLPKSGREPADAPAYEVYLNSPRDTAPDQLVTEICVPLRPTS